MTLSIDDAGLSLSEDEQEALRRMNAGTAKAGDEVILAQKAKRAAATPLSRHMSQLHSAIALMRADLDNLAKIVNDYEDPSSRKAGLRELKIRLALLVEEGEHLLYMYRKPVFRGPGE